MQTPPLKICILFISIFIGISVSAQKDRKLSHFQLQVLERADTFFSEENYYNALINYEKVLRKKKNDTSIILKMAECRKMLNEYKESEVLYGKILNNDNIDFVDSRHILNYAQILTINNNYSDALIFFKKYYSMNSKDSRGLAGINTINNLSQLFYDTIFYAVFPSSINTVYAEFSPVLYNDGIVFISDRNKTRISKSHRGKDLGFTKWYYFDESKSGCSLFGNNLNKETNYNLGPMVFYENFQKIIFSQNMQSKPSKKDKTVVHSIQLYTASKNNEGEWENIKKLDFCNESYSYGQPAITSDGKTLIFSSDMPGGQGGKDLYISRYENGNWKNPENLGKNINSESNEMFPFLLNDSILYFSSDGHGGLGGLEICYVNLYSGETPERFGMPLNSSGDDFGIIFSADGMSGYFTSNRAESVGSDDIYTFKIIRISITLQIIDRETSEPIANANVLRFIGEDENAIGTTDSDGRIELIVPVGDEIRVKVDKENFESQTFLLDRQKLKTENTFILEAENIKIVEDIAHFTAEADSLVYKVQIAAGRVPLPKKDIYERYKGNMTFTMSYEDSWYKYTIGEFSTYEEARKCLEESNVYDAFVPVYLNNKRVKILFPRPIVVKRK